MYEVVIHPAYSAGFSGYTSSRQFVEGVTKSRNTVFKTRHPFSIEWVTAALSSVFGV